MLSPDASPVALINRVLDAQSLPHIRHLACRQHACRGVVAGHRTEWRVYSQARLVCICYLMNPPKPTPRP